MASSLEEVSAPVCKFFWHVQQTAWYHIPEDWNLNGYSSKLTIPCIHCSILVLDVVASSNYCLCTEIIQTLYHSWTWFQQNTWLYKIICSKFYSVSMHACMHVFLLWFFWHVMVTNIPQYLQFSCWKFRFTCNKYSIMGL